MSYPPGKRDRLVVGPWRAVMANLGAGFCESELLHDKEEECLTWQHLAWLLPTDAAS